MKASFVSACLVLAAVPGAALPGAALAADGKVKIGVLSDMGGVYADITGPGSVVAARMAVEDFGGKALGQPIELVTADHQAKPDIGLSIARAWLDTEGVDAIVDVPVSSVGLGIQALTKEKRKVFLNTAGASSDFTGTACSPYATQWAMDTYTMASSSGRALVKAGGNKWFFITADYAFGHALERDATAAVKEAGGTVVGSARHPLNNQDFASHLLQAQSAGANVVGLANGTGDTVRSINQAREFGLNTAGIKMAALVLFISDVHALGLPAAQGTLLTESFYWGLDDETRAWGRRFMERNNGRAPGMYHAGVYSAVTHYLKAVEKAGGTDAAKVSAAMREMLIKDPLIKNGHIRADGKVMQNYYLLEVKKPADSKGPWDYYNVLATVPAEDATKQLSRSECPDVKTPG
ncbi:branched-chain amino acid transport system substrate-binding protein [Bosea sp. CRIB-10]|uniref:ABC transporter substrate-binding protein n=1 Tax=Bosea sp. CRIB-10 TaxID=378404 RepID=UPI0008EA12F9|nr:ABC transporter substrate-binding protein [Bosea sp. CRIB-10]SFC09944.1 branched-chain amino acid transport system substrate-binding protein [Bosea sp. CRIB-10]